MSERRDIKLYYPRVVQNYTLRNLSYTLASNGVCTVFFNEPKKLNRWTFNCVIEMGLVLEHLRQTDSVKVVVWTGKGRAFTSGAAFEAKPRVFIPKEVMDAYIEKNLLGPRSDFVLKALTLAFMKFPKPSICAVNGLTVGGGVNFAWFFHDIVIASESSKFKYPFTDIGITPELASSALLPLAVGPRQSKRLFLLGPWVSAREALSMGLVDEITPNDMLMPRAKALAEKLIQKSLVAVRLSKQLVLESMGGVSGLAKVLDREAVAFAKAFSSDEFAARVSAFRKRFGSKRSPRRRLSAKL